MSGREVIPLHQYEAFRIVVLRVIESFVYKSLDETISLLKITTVINNNPLTKLVRTQISPDRSAANLPKVTIRDVILSITKIFQSSDIQILANNDNFKIKLSRNDFQALVDKHYGRYIENTVESIRDYEDDHDKVLKEILQIEKGELDQVIIHEHRQALAQRQQLQQQQQQQQQNNAPNQTQTQSKIQEQHQVPPSLQKTSPQAQNLAQAQAAQAAQQKAQQTPQSSQNQMPQQETKKAPSQSAHQSPPSQTQPISQQPISNPIPAQQTVLDTPDIKESKQHSSPQSSSVQVRAQPQKQLDPLPKKLQTSQQLPQNSTFTQLQGTSHKTADLPSKTTDLNDTLKPNQPIIPIKSENQVSKASDSVGIATRNDNTDKVEVGDKNGELKDIVKHETGDARVVHDNEEGDDIKAPTPEATTPDHESTEEAQSGRPSTRSSPRKTRASSKDGKALNKERDTKKEEVERQDEEDEEDESEEETGKRSTRSQTDRKRKSFREEESQGTPAKKKARYSTTDVPSSPGGPLHAPPNKKLQILSNPLIANISSYKYASTFLQPVQESNAPDYYEIIKEPRDLKTIRQMIKDGRIQSGEQLERDILLMFANAIMYNKTGSDVYNWSKEMQVETDKFLQLFKESNND